MNTTSVGQAAEAAVSKKLAQSGYHIIYMNWRRPRCEIDIVAKKGKVVYFIEVKHRTKSSQGTGLEYITPRKLKQMEYAAMCWTAENSWDGDYRLMAAEVRADELTPVVEQIIELS
jgi:putative endonuclease